MLQPLYMFPEGQIIAFALVFLRIIAFVVSMPIIGTQSVPVSVKVLFSLILTMILFPLANMVNTHQVNVSDQLIFFSIREVVVGLMMGFIMRFFFFAIAITGEILGISSSMSSVQLFNPAMGSQGNPFDQFLFILTTLFFLGINGHHFFIQGIAQSLELLPISQIGFNYQKLDFIFSEFSNVILMGVKLSAPILISIFIANVAMEVLGRTVPQLNVLMTSFPITIGLTFFIFFITIPYYLQEMSSLVEIMSRDFFKLMRVL